MKQNASSVTNYSEVGLSAHPKLEAYAWKNLISFSFIVTIMLSLIALIYLRYNNMSGVGDSEGRFSDFDAFYTAGKMFWAGEINQAYNPKYFFAAMEADAGRAIFMPWTYPPPYNILTIVLPLIDRASSYALFISVTFIIFIGAAYRLSGDLITIPVVLTAPAGIITVMGGQNSFLTAALIAVFCHAMINQATARQAGNISLGIMIIKPHLALGLGFMLLLQKNWYNVISVFMIISILLFVSLLIFGYQIFPSFFSAVSYSKSFLQQGLYPMDRMTSVYAFLFTISGKNYLFSILIHALVAVCSLVCIWYSISHRWEIHRVLSVACVATLMVSPYNYDYDTMILAIPLSLAARELVVFSSAYEKVLLFSLCWLTTGWGTLSTFWVKDLSALEGSVYSFGGLGLVGFFIVFLKILMKAESANERGREDQQELC